MFLSEIHDKHINLLDQRYWIEYHSIDGQRMLSSKYYLIPPSNLSHQVAQSKLIHPYRKWVNFKDEAHYIHIPFDFNTINNRKLRDRIANVDQNIMIAKSKYYHNTPKTYSCNHCHCYMTFTFVSKSGKWECKPKIF